MLYMLNVFFLGVSAFYFIYLMLYATYLFVSVAAGAFRLYKQDRMLLLRNELKHNYYIPISIIVPAYNEEVTIVDSINSLLSLDYQIYEIIVVDDGSKDNTAVKLIEAFNMRPYSRPIRQMLDCKPCRKVYETQIGSIKLTLIRKVNGGKGDALNMGINASLYPYFICIDADSMLQRDSLVRIAQPLLEDGSVVAVGGLIRVAQCVKIKGGMIKSNHLPSNLIVGLQVVEYDRSFLGSRILMDLYNGNLIVSGAFGLFKKSAVVAAGGYSLDSLGEDMELIIKLHVFCRHNNLKYRIRFEPNAVCWSQAPSTLQDIMKQRRRWNLGLFQSMLVHRQIFFNMKFGGVSFITYMYYLLYELLSPFIEVFGVSSIIIASAFGVLDARFMLLFFCLYSLYGAVLSITAFCQRIYTQHLQIKRGDILRAMLMCLLEIGIFRYILSFARLASYIGYKKDKLKWGSIKRAEFRV